MTIAHGDPPDNFPNSAIEGRSARAVGAGDRAIGAGALPRHVIPGESHHWETINEDTGECFLIVPDGRGGFRQRCAPMPGVNPYSAITDWLNCTFLYESDQRALELILEVPLHALGTRFYPITRRDRGLLRYKNSFALGVSGAVLAFGDNTNRAMLQFSGTACDCVPDWAALALALQTLPGCRITRWDGAVDDYEGLHSVDTALQMYKDNHFLTHGRPPSLKMHGNWLYLDGRGRTLYVGHRSNGKMLRIYDKGMQLKALYHPWVRWEIELHNRDRVIPFDVLTNPGGYVVGAFPRALEWVGEPACRIATQQLKARLTYEDIKANLRRSYGQHLGVVEAVEGSAEAALEILKRPGLPARLDFPTI